MLQKYELCLLPASKAKKTPNRQNQTRQPKKRLQKSIRIRTLDTNPQPNRTRRKNQSHLSKNPNPKSKMKEETHWTEKLEQEYKKYLEEQGKKSL